VAEESRPQKGPLGCGFTRMPSRLRGILATVSDVACADTVGGQLIHFLLGNIKINTGNLGKGSQMTPISIGIFFFIYYFLFIFKKRHHFVQTFARVTLLHKSSLVDNLYTPLFKASN
jgi:hypothetical protein